MRSSASITLSAIVICSRLMLFHLVGRQEEAIRRIVLCLKAGGLLVDEDADLGTISCSVTVFRLGSSDLFRPFQES